MLSKIKNKKCSKCNIIKNINNYYMDRKKYYYSACKECGLKYSIKYLNDNPWVRTYQRITSRCNAKGSNYNKKGIFVNITSNELKQLWFRDKAYLLSRPSIDRINPKGNYELSNCRYIELFDNISHGAIARWKKWKENNIKGIKI